MEIIQIFIVFLMCSHYKSMQSFYIILFSFISQLSYFLYMYNAFYVQQGVFMFCIKVLFNNIFCFGFKQLSQCLYVFLNLTAGEETLPLSDFLGVGAFLGEKTFIRGFCLYAACLERINRVKKGLTVYIYSSVSSLKFVFYWNLRGKYIKHHQLCLIS